MTVVSFGFKCGLILLRREPISAGAKVNSLLSIDSLDFITNSLNTGNGMVTHGCSSRFGLCLRAL